METAWREFESYPEKEQGRSKRSRYRGHQIQEAGKLEEMESYIFMFKVEAKRSSSLRRDRDAVVCRPGTSEGGTDG